MSVHKLMFGLGNKHLIAIDLTYTSLVVLLFWNLSVCAQNQPDTTMPDIYRKVEAYSKNKRLAELLHHIIVSPVSVPAVTTHHHDEISIQQYQNMVIRKIVIESLDPFGFKPNDSTAYPRSWLEKTGNRLHIRTQKQVFYNRLLIHPFDAFDTLAVNESERLIRNLPFVHEVVLYCTQAGTDSVDIIFRVSDLWSITAEGAVAADKFNIQLSDRNLFGSGHTYSQSVNNHFGSNRLGYTTGYYLPNIYDSYISARLNLSRDENYNYRYSAIIERQLFSSLSKWGGGINLTRQKQPVILYAGNAIPILTHVATDTYDCWAAKAWQIFNGKLIADRNTNLIVAGRYFRSVYAPDQTDKEELKPYFTNSDLVLFSLGIASRNYLPQKYIFRYGTTEDVPLGITYSLTAGWQNRSGNQWYMGFQYAWGNMFRAGYLGTHIEYGWLKISESKNQSVFLFRMNAFSKLYQAGKWRFRQFVRPEYMLGINQPPYLRLTINDGNGLNSFNSNSLTGLSRLLLTLQSQAYAPWDILGFRFGPYMNVSLGMLSDQNGGFGNSRVYTQIGFGMLIRNDYLVFKHFQISFAFYPSIPGKGDNVLKLNPFKTTDFGLPEFSMGKPQVVEYQ